MFIIRLRLICLLLGYDLEPFVFVYLDNVIVVTPTFEKHLDILEVVLNRLTNAGLSLSREKCKFCVPELTYLGYVVGRRGLQVNPAKPFCAFLLLKQFRKFVWCDGIHVLSPTFPQWSFRFVNFVNC